MTMRVTMLNSRRGEGVDLIAGQTYTVSDALGAQLVGAGHASDTDKALTPPGSEPVRASTNPLTGGIELTAGGEVIELGGQAVASAPVSHTLLDFQFSDAATGWSTGTTHSVSYDAINKGLRIRGNGVSGTNILTTKTLPRTIEASQIKRVAVKFRSNTPGLQAGMNLQFMDGTNFSGLSPAYSLFQVDASEQPEWRWAVYNTSEDSTWASLTTITQLRIRTSGQSAPFLNDVTIAKIVINPDTISPICFTFDDGWDSAYTKAMPILAAANMAGTVFVPTAGASGVVANRRLDNAEMQSLASAGWAVSIDGTDDDSVLTAAASLDAAMAKFLNGQYLGTKIGTSVKNLSYLCYPNGIAWAIGAPVQIAAATSNGTTAVTLGSAATIAAGSAYYATNAPDGTTVTVGGVGVTSITVSNTIPTGTVAAACVDLSSQFSYAAIISRLASAGVRGARLTNLGDASIVEGLLRPLAVTGQGWTGATLNQAIATLTTARNRGMPIVMYMHEVQDDVGGWTADTPNASIHVYQSFLQGIVNLVKGWVSDGTAEVLTFPAFVEKYRA